MIIRTVSLGLALALVAGLAAAQTPPARPAPAPASKAPSASAPTTTPAAPVVPLGPPRAFPGYSQPEIPAAACRVVSQTQAMCTIPAMTAGRYIARASGTSTAQGEGAAQALVIQVGARACGRVDRRPTTQSPWTSGPKTLVGACDFVVVIDRPVQVIVACRDTKATRDPKGPTLRIERAPWDGIISAQMSAPEQAP